MKGFCPSCEKDSELNRIQKIENLNVKGEIIPVDVDFYVCAECGAEFDNPDPEYDPLKTAYEIYRRRKGMVQPKEIKAFREHYNLTQRELSDLTGFGGATLSRYENGSLQDETHDTLLRLLMQPDDLLKIVVAKEDIIPPKKRERLIEQLRGEIRKNRLVSFLKSFPHYDHPNIQNGHQNLNPDKMINVIKVMCYPARVPKTKLNKLLFYTDFLHFKNYGHSITGLCYAHLPYGPVPDQYETLYEALLDLDSDFEKIEEPINDHTAEYFVCHTEPETTGLSLQEIQTVVQVIQRFQKVSAGEIVEISHQEMGYQKTQVKEIISYQYAESLKL